MFRFVASSSEGHPDVAKSCAPVDTTESCHARAAPGWEGESSRRRLGRCSHLLADRGHRLVGPSPPRSAHGQSVANSRWRKIGANVLRLDPRAKYSRLRTKKIRRCSHGLWQSSAPLVACNLRIIAPRRCPPPANSMTQTTANASLRRRSHIRS